jgi:uncharacterized protein YutE (UPF0331/DUF86 family)
MYFVDREHIEDQLLFLDRQLIIFNKQESWESEIEKIALERIFHTIIESILDTGNAMIDGFIMRDPGSYEDIVDILLDEKVVDEALAESLKSIITYRKILVQEYTKVDHQSLLKSFKENLQNLKQFSEKVRTYLIEELGPVSAFRN